MAMRRAPFLIVPLAMSAAVLLVVLRAHRTHESVTPVPARGEPATGDPATSAPPTPGTSDPQTPARGAIKVSVTGPSGILADVRVMIMLEATHDSFDRVTGVSGECTFEGIGPGNWLVGARHSRFLPATSRAIVQEGHTTEVALRLDEGGRAQGVVRTSAGQPLAGATIVILDPERRIELHQGLVARADEQGQYLIEGIPLQKVGIGARAPRYRPVERYDLVWSLPGELQRHDFTLELGTSISGRVIDETGAPIADADVQAVNEFATITKTDREGRFTLAGLGDKPVGLSASARGYGTVYLRNVPANSQGVELRLSRGGRLEGRVVPALESFSLLLYRFEPDAGQQLLVRTWPYRGVRGGEFVLTDVSRGEYELAIDAPGYETVARVKAVVNPGETVSGITIEVRRKQ